MKPEQLTAWALDQLTSEEKAKLEAELLKNPEEQKQAATTQDFCTFLSRELKDKSLCLTEEQRRKLLSASRGGFQPAKQTFKPTPLRWYQRPLVPLAAAAGVMIGGAVYLMPEAHIKTTEAPLITVSSEMIKVRKADFQSHIASLPQTSGKTAASPLNDSITSVVTSLSPFDAPSPLMRESVFALASDKLIQSPVTEQVLGSHIASPPTLLIANVNVGSAVPLGKVIIIENASPVAAPVPEIPAYSKWWGGASINTGSVAMSGSISPGIPLPGSSATALRKQEFGDRRADTETYAPISENVLTSVARTPLSTFSIDVDTASYANVRRFLNQNTQPPRDAVRVEEIINYFPSTEPGPAADSKQPFAVKVEMAACPWQPQHRLARIHLKGRDIGMEHKPSNLVFLVDVSGSMAAPEKLALVQRSLRMLTERLSENDRVALVTYAGGTALVLPSTNGTAKAEIIAAIDRLQAGGSTHGSAGIRLAYEQAVAGFIKEGVNRVILCTDGDFNVGLSSPQELENLITEKARSGVFLSVLGYGTGNMKDHSMETLADKGNGNYAYIDSIGEARKVLVEQMQGTLITIAKDVKIQVEFNPALIREYRLIGYENRLLAKEDFNDDTKDAGEIGAGHSVTALYELVPANLTVGQTPVLAVEPLKYQPQQMASPPPPGSQPASISKEALTVKLRYKEPAGTTSKLIEVALNDDSRPIEKASAEFKFSAAVAGFGMLLRESSFTSQLSWETVRQLAREGKGSDALGYRGEFLQLIEKASGK